MDLSAFLDRRGPESLGEETEPFADRAGGWLDLMAQAHDLHPITRACMGFHLWSLAGFGQHDDRTETGVSRIAASEGTHAVYAPLATRALNVASWFLRFDMSVLLVIGEQQTSDHSFRHCPIFGG